MVSSKLRDKGTQNSPFSLNTIGFQQSKSDYSFFTKYTKSGFLALFVYVVDILIGSNDLDVNSDLKSYLYTKFRIKDLGQSKYFLGLEIARSTNGITLCQRKYALEILETSGLLSSKTTGTPEELNHKLSHSADKLLPDAVTYRKLIGKLIYLTLTRLDISYFVNILS